MRVTNAASDRSKIGSFSRTLIGRESESVSKQDMFRFDVLFDCQFEPKE